jgi:hypothetical protein
MRKKKNRRKMANINEKGKGRFGEALRWKKAKKNFRDEI